MKPPEVWSQELENHQEPGLLPPLLCATGLRTSQLQFILSLCPASFPPLSRWVLSASLGTQSKWPQCQQVLTGISVFQSNFLGQRMWLAKLIDSDATRSQSLMSKGNAIT